MVNMRIVVMRIMTVEKELAAAACGAGGVGVGGSDGVSGSDGCSLHEQRCAELSHRAAQLEEEQNKCEHRVAGCTGDSDRTPPESQGSTSWL